MQVCLASSTEHKISLDEEKTIIDQARHMFLRALARLVWIVCNASNCLVFSKEDDVCSDEEETIIDQARQLREPGPRGHNII